MIHWFKRRRTFDNNGSRTITEETLRNSRDRVFRALIENAADIITILSAEGTIEYESPSVKRVLGFDPEELVGRNSFEFVHPEDVQRVVAKFQEVIGSDIKGQGEEFRFLHKDGSWRYLELTGTNLLQDKMVEGIVVNSRDVTERKRAEYSMRESEERYALAVRGANDGIWDWDLEKNLIYLSPRWKAMLGFAENDLRGSADEWFQRIHPQDSAHLRLTLTAHLEGRAPHFECEYRIRHRDGSYRFMLTRGLAIRNATGVALRIAGSQTDITDRKRAEERLVHGALHDGLTGLPNRALFLDRLKGAIARSQSREGYQFAVFFLDLDRFKVVNDSLGHEIGDQLLVEVSRVLEKCVRPEDTVARLGGDEFVILIDDRLKRNEASGIAQKIHDCLLAPFNVAGHKVFTTASIGVVFNSPQHERAEDFIRDSDIAMYRAKSLGKARSEIFDISMRAKALHLQELETDLRYALERNEFESWYQPIVEIATGKITGFESLARWRSSKRGLVMPNDFIPIAEETGIMVGAGLMILRQACEQLSRWRHDFPDLSLFVSVNVSSCQFVQPHLVEHVAEILQESNVEPSQLRLEITESVLIGDVEAAKSILNPLRDLGIKICLDDFGTGYSSLSYLIKLPIDILKIDRSFINGIEDKQEERAVVLTIIALAQTLGMGVVAEGVETIGQLRQLYSLNCDSGQGYFFSRPVEASVATQQIIDQRFTRFGCAANNTANTDRRTQPELFPIGRQGYRKR